MVQSSLSFFIKIYYGITQFCLFGSIGIVTITAFDRFLTIKSSNLSTRRFRYHLYSVFILLFSGKKSSLYSSSDQEFSVLMTGPLFIKTQIIDYENDASDIECKINWSSLRWILLFIDRFVEMKKATSMLETMCVGDKSASQKCHLSHQRHCGRKNVKITWLFKYERLQKAF